LRKPTSPDRGQGCVFQLTRHTATRQNLCSGNDSAYFARWDPNCPRGDMNCDQAIDLAGTPLVNGLDAQAFIDCLVSGACQ
jgi:hypothetical protein